jgi:DNA-binding HxlR family transcriptional regulator
MRDSLHGLKRFDEFQRSLKIARNTLSDRLNKLVDSGVMTKRFYQDNPPRYEYVLTEMGRDFFPALAAMLSWGDKWLDDGGGAPVSLHHHTHGHPLATEVICLECSEPIKQEDVQFVVGPGYPEHVRPEVDIRYRLAEEPGGPGGMPFLSPAGTAVTAPGSTATKKPTKKRAPARQGAAKSASGKRVSAKTPSTSRAAPSDRRRS